MIGWWAASVAVAVPDEVRLALIVSSNQGLAGEEPLLYANADAERVADVLQSLGGYGRGDVWIVPDGTVDDLFTTLTRVTVRAQEVATAGGHPSLLVFYAGHAGTDGLHLGDQVLPLPDLKAAIRVVPADDRIVVLDACNAGAIVRSRGSTLIEVRDRPLGFEPPPDEAWFTSSGPEERSFEVEDRRGALFTHFFLSGARGAADADTDARVTLGELYAFVQAQTAAAAADLGQLQRPRWSGALASFTLTTLGASPTGVRVVGPIEAPLLLIDEQSARVVAEVPRGAGAHLALPSGSYQVITTRDGNVSLGHLVVPDDSWTVWDPGATVMRRATVRTRGGLYDLTPWALGGGYALGLNTLPGRIDAHAAYVDLLRELGRGHTAEITVTAGWLPYGGSWWQGTDAFLEVRGTWTRRLLHGPLGLAPGLAVALGGTEHRTERSPHPIWGAWYGSSQGASRTQRATGGLEAGLSVVVPLSTVELRSWGGIGVAAGDPGSGLQPSLTARTGLAVPFR